jgi:hypothetical protein
MSDPVRAEFLRWFYGSKYGQVALPSGNMEQIAWDAWAAAREALSTPAWVPVSERLPEPGVEVLTWGPIASMHWGIDVVRVHGEFFYSSFPKETTHWMPLPPAPAQEKETGPLKETR